MKRIIEMKVLYLRCKRLPEQVRFDNFFEQRFVFWDPPLMATLVGVAVEIFVDSQASWQ